MWSSERRDPRAEPATACRRSFRRALRGGIVATLLLGPAMAVGAQAEPTLGAADHEPTLSAADQEPTPGAADQEPTLGAQGSEASLDILSELRRGSVNLTLPATVERALRTSSELRQGRAELRGAVAGEAVAAALLLPRLDLTAQYKRTSEVEASLVPEDPQQVSDLASARAARVIEPDSRLDVNQFPQFPNLYTARAELSYPLTELLWIRLPSRAAARDSASVSRWNLRTARARVALRAREATYGYMRARARLLVAQTTLARAQRHREAASYRVQAGVASKSETLAAGTRVSQAELGVARARGPLWRAKAELEAVLDRELPDEIGVDEPIDQPPTARVVPPPATLIARAFANRPELIALRHMAGVRRSEHDATLGAQLPQVSLIAGLDLQNPAPRSFPYRDDFGTAWDVGAKLSWSPNDLLVGNRRGDEQRAAVAQAMADLELMRTAIRQEVAQARADYVASVEALGSARANVEIAEENYEVHLELFRLGRVASLDLMQADEALHDARLDFVNTAIDVRLADIHLAFAQGASP